MLSDLMGKENSRYLKIKAQDTMEKLDNGELFVCLLINGTSALFVLFVRSTVKNRRDM